MQAPYSFRFPPLICILLTGVFGSVSWYLAFVGLMAGAAISIWFATPFWWTLIAAGLLGWLSGALTEALQIQSSMALAQRQSA